MAETPSPSVAPRAASSRGVVPPPRTTARGARGPRTLVRPVQAAAQPRSAAARKRGRATRGPVIIVTGPIGGGKSSVVATWPRAGRARRHAQILAGLGHHAAASARRWHRPRCLRLWQCVRLLRAGRGPPSPSPRRKTRSVIIETTRQRTPRCSRASYLDAILRELARPRAFVVFVADARDVRKQLAAPDSPGAPNPHRLQLLAANHAWR